MPNLLLRLQRHYHQVLAEVTAENESHALPWLSVTLTVILAFSVVDFTRMNLPLTLSAELQAYWYLVKYRIILGYSCYLVIKAVRQPVLYSVTVDFESRTTPPMVRVELLLNPHPPLIKSFNLENAVGRVKSLRSLSRSNCVF